MKRVWMLMVFVLASVSLVGAQEGVWEVEKRCVELQYPVVKSDDWDFRGTIIVDDNDGVKALRSGWASYFLGIDSNEAYGRIGTISPDGKYFAYTIGTAEIGNNSGELLFSVQKVILVEVAPTVERVVMELQSFTTSFGKRGIPVGMWVDNDTYYYDSYEYSLDKSVKLVGQNPKAQTQYYNLQSYELSNDRIVQVVENELALVTPRVVKKIISSSDNLRDYDVSPDERYVAFVNEQYLFLADLAAEIVYDLCTWVGSTEPVIDRIAFSPDSQFLAFITDNYVTVLDLRNNRAEILDYVAGSVRDWVANDDADFQPLPTATPTSTPTPTRTPPPSATPMPTATLDTRPCKLTLLTGANLRISPDSAIAPVGSRAEGDELTPDGTVLNSSGRWYRLGEDEGVDAGSFILESLVDVEGACYELPEVEFPDVTATPTPAASEEGCTVTTLSAVNLRAGAGTTFEQKGSRLADDKLLADAQSTDAEGFVWWRLADAGIDTGLWVRSDFVSESAACASLPTP